MTSPSDDLAACVQCGLCLSSCPTFRLSGMEGYSPRGRIAAIRAARDAPGTVALLDEYLDTCLGCRACESVCPSGVPYGRILEEARETLPPAGGPLARAAERVMLWTISRPGRLAAATVALWPLQRLGLLGLTPVGRGIPKLRLRNVLARMGTNYVPSEGTADRGQVVLFTGCVQDAWARDVHWATIQVLTRAGYRVKVPYSQSCCGALHAHAGHVAAARSLARRNLEPLQRYEGPIVVNSAGCGAKLKEYGHLLEGDEDAEAVARRVVDVTELLRPADVRAMRAAAPPGLARIAVHDPCHLNFVQRVHDQPRALLRAAGYDVVDLDDGGRCCGAAGSYSVRHPDWARPLLEQKLDACARTGADAVAVANPGCAFWMQSSPGMRMYHPVQLLAMAALGAADQTSG